MNTDSAAVAGSVRSGQADPVALAGPPGLADPDGLLAMIVGAEAGTGPWTAAATASSGRTEPDGLSERADPAEPAAPTWPASRVIGLS